MKRSEKTSFQRVLMGALSVLVAVTLVLTCNGYSAAGFASAIGDNDTPLAGPAEPSAADADEAARAEAERAESPDDLGYVPGEIVIIYEDDATEVEKDAVSDLVEGAVASEEAVFDTGAAATVEISDDLTVETAVDRAQSDPAVKYALPNYTVSLMDEPAAATLGATAKLDERQSQQWYLDYVDAPEAWSLLADAAGNVGAAPVRVGVIDTGASLSHPDLTNVINREKSIEVVHGKDAKDTSSWHGEPLRGDGYVNGGATVEEHSSHGTHVCGIIAAEAGNGGVLGVASGGGTKVANEIVDVVAIDAFSDKTQDARGNWVAGGTFQDILFAMEYARDAGCSIVNMSLGFNATDQQLIDAFEEIASGLLRSSDMLIVAAAGNEGARKQCVPAACGSVLGVISLTQEGHETAGWNSIGSATWVSDGVTRSAFSNYGSWCDIAAPGEAIQSTYFSRSGVDSYANMDGTSMACPVVAAVAAMVRAADPSLTAAETRDILCRTATDLADAGKDDQSGYGAVNAEAAVAAALPPAVQQTESDESQGSQGAQEPEPATPAPSSGGSLGSSPAPSPSPSPTPAPAPDEPAADDEADGDGAAEDVPDDSTNEGEEGSGDASDVGDDSSAVQQPARAGWQSSGGAWRYQLSDGTYATGWLKDGKTWYHLNTKGVMATGWAKVGKSWYYFDTSGAMATGWAKVNKSWYYLKGSGAMATGWYKAGSKWYYSNSSGVMQSGKWIGNYYVTSSGAMATDTWIGKYHVNASGKWDKTR